MFFQIDIKIVKKQEPWKKVLASLDPAKVAAIEVFEKKRIKDLRDFRVASKVQELDDMLLLSASQRTELTEIVDRVSGDQLALQPRNNGIFAGGAMVVVMAGQASKEIPKDELKRVLSEVQFAEYENMLNRQAQGPFNPAAPPAGFGKNKKNNNDEPQSSSLGFTFKEKESGLSVESVTSDSRADQAGLKAGDIIDAIDGKPIDNTVQLKRAIALNTSKTLTMQVKRDGTDLKLEFPSKK
jgi:S1-C subfamily serine protease